MILVSAFGGLVLLAGCQKEIFTRNGQVAEVPFGASSNSSNSKTRTEYGTFSNGKQEILWNDSDEIRVYSPTAARRVGLESAMANLEPGQEPDPSSLYFWADYGVIPFEDDKTQAKINNLSNDGQGNPYDQSQVDYEVGNGLAWVYGQDSVKHTFYAIYPAPYSAEGKNNTLNGCNGLFNLSIPSGNQAFSEMGNISSYGYMTAVSEPLKASPNAKVLLDFYPSFSAFEISIRSAAEAIALSEFKLISANEGLTGAYSVSYDANGNADYDCSGTGKEITVNLTGRSAPAASENKDLVFSVLALPRDYTSLTVQFTTTTGVTRSLKLKYDDDYSDTSLAGKSIKFSGLKRHRIYGLVLPNGELLISVNTAPWLAGGIHTFTTIEDVTTFFLSYKRYNEQQYYNGSASWFSPYVNYIAIAPGRSTTDRVDPEDSTSELTNLPLYSPMIELNTISVGVPLELRSDNPKVGFVTAVGGIYSTTPSQTLSIRASSSITDQVATSYFVVPLDDSAIGEVANISLVRTDSNTPIAFSHSDMPGTTDHTKVPYIVLSVGDYNSKTHDEVPSI